jgi:hypothetical protein
VWITLGIVIVFAIAMRIPSLSRSFWLDEVWVANSVVAPTFSQMVYYEGWLNTSPPLFLLLVRWTTQLFGVTHESMRLVPVLCGILSVPAMAYLALRLLQPWYALVAVVLFSLSQDHIILTQSVKQYATDVFVSLIFLILGYRFLTTRSRNTFYCAVFVFIIFGFLSYQAMMFLPVFFYATYFDFQNTNRIQNRHNNLSNKLIDAIIFIYVIFSVSAINYFYFIKPNVDLTLIEHQADGFYHGTSVLDFIVYIVAALANLSHPFYPDIRSSLLLRIATLVIILLGMVGFAWRREARPIPQWEIVVLLGLPILSLVVLNLFGQYPISRTPRLLLFVFPVVALLFASGIQFVMHLFCTLGKENISIFATVPIEQTIAPWILVVIAGLFVVRFLFVDLAPYFGFHSPENTEAAIRYLSQQHTNGDLLYVHSSMREHFKFYSRRWPIRGGRVVEGKIGWPCCPRPASVIDDRGMHPAKVIPVELARLHLPSAKHQVRLLFTGRQSHWDTMIGRDDPHAFDLQLSERGCIRAQIKAFKGVRIHEYLCPSTPSAD